MMTDNRWGLGIFLLVAWFSPGGLSYDPGGQALGRVEGAVGAGNYTRYSTKEDRPFDIVLTSLQGDADLYVSGGSKQPTFAFEEHTTSSASCGVDVIHVPRNAPRPINIAVYGHPRYDVAHFVLEIFLSPEEFDPYRADGDGNTKGAPRGERRATGDAAHGEDDDDESSLWKTVLNILQELVLILLDILL